MSGADRRRIVPWLAVAAGVFALWALAVAWSGGFHIPLGPVAVSSRKASRPGLVALVLMAVAIWLLGREERRRLANLWIEHIRAASDSTSRLRRYVPSARLCVLALAGAIGMLGWLYGSQTAGGSDAFAYVSQAALFRTGRLDVPVPLAARAPWPDAAESFAPLGYRARTDGRAVVPITAPGVPLVMAAFQIVGGHRAAFLVTPVAAAVTIWVTFLLGRQVRSRGAGLAAAWLVATSPAFLFMLMWPMTDIPAAMWAGIMVCLLLRDDTQSSLFAGLAASMGILTRPNFVLLAAAALGWLVLVALATRERAPVKRAAVFAGALLPGAAASIWLNIRWYGRALASGYGNPGELLSLERAVTNAERYGTWLVQTSPILIVGLTAMVLPLALFWGRQAWRVPLLFTATTAATVSVYLGYQSFNDWWYLRFLLPVWPLAAVSTAVVFVATGRASRIAGAIGAVVVIVAGIAGVKDAKERGLFLFGEDRYATVASLVASTTEPTAVIFTISHSGSVRYYAGRETIRFNAIEPAWLDRAVAWLAARGRKPYILVEDWELPYFREQFAGQGSLGQLAFPPAATWESTKVAGRVFLYDPIDRGRFGTADPGVILERNQPRSAPSRFPKLAFE